jgi:hypothetical protein
MKAAMDMPPDKWAKNNEDLADRVREAPPPGGKETRVLSSESRAVLARVTAYTSLNGRVRRVVRNVQFHWRAGDQRRTPNREA